MIQLNLKKKRQTNENYTEELTDAIEGRNICGLADFVTILLEKKL